MAAAGDEAGVPLWHSPESAGGDLVLSAARHCGHQGTIHCYCFIIAVDPDPDPVRIQGFDDQKLKKKNTSVADPWHFGVDPDPDPRIHASD